MYVEEVHHHILTLVQTHHHIQVVAVVDLVTLVVANENN